MTWSKFNPCGPCCGCDYFTDDFNRANNTDVGASYTEVSGDWSVTSTALLIQALNAIITIDVAHPDDEPNGAIAFAFFAFNDGDQPRFIFDYQDTDNYKFVQITVGDPNGCLAIYERASGTNTLLASRRVAVPNNAFGSCYVYWGPHPDGHNYIAALMPDDSFNVEEAYVEVRGITFTNDAKGFGSGSLTSAIFFDQVTIWKHWHEDSESCPYVAPLCVLIDDDFDGASDIGCSWVETGTWSIDTDVAAGSTDDALTSDTGAMLVSQNAHPDGRLKMVAVVLLSSAGDSCNLWIEHEELYLKIAIVDADTFSAQLFDSTGSLTDAQPGNLTGLTNAYLTVTLCYDGATVAYVVAFSNTIVSGTEDVVVTATGKAAIEFSGTGSLRVSRATVTRMPDENNPGCVGCVAEGDCCLDPSSELTFAVRVELGEDAWFTDAHCGICEAATSGSKILGYAGSCLYRGREGECDFGLDDLNSTTLAAILIDYAPATCTVCTPPITDMATFVHSVALITTASGKNQWVYRLQMSIPEAEDPTDDCDGHSKFRAIPFATFHSAEFTGPCDDFPYTLTQTDAPATMPSTQISCQGDGQTRYDVDPPRDQTCGLGTIPGSITLWGV